MTNNAGVVAAGHEKTAEAAQIMLSEGGNAFDAVLAALFSACVAEPVLASLGGGGFLQARPTDRPARLFDFFAQTPQQKKPPGEIDFYPILADFGTAQQEFHIGFGSIATPGVPRGLFRIHQDLATLPLKIIVEPALTAAREGVRLNGFQHYISTIVAPIIGSTPEALQLHQSPAQPGRLAREGEVLKQPEMAQALEALVHEGEGLFYQGELAGQIARDCQEKGGHLSERDLDLYQVEIRDPLETTYQGVTILTNPPPSLGGLLIAFTLALLEPQRIGSLEFGSAGHIELLAEAMRLTQSIRSPGSPAEESNGSMPDESILESPFLARYIELLKRHTTFSRGTTQISVADRLGNLASMTLSNGEGSGYVVPGTGIMLNNMLGEEDLNPRGFHRWRENRRIASMMAPTLLFARDGSTYAIGSGGSNRIRSAILQVISNLVDFKMNLFDAVNQPRIHFEAGLLNLENGLPDAAISAIRTIYQNHKLWGKKNLFFGGVHSVQIDGKGNSIGAADPRRGGVHRLAP